MKKLISIILTACICLSLLGGISFAGAEGTVEVFDGSYTYNFLTGQGDNKIVHSTDLYTVKDYTSSPFFFFGADEMLSKLISEIEKGESAAETLYFNDNEIEYPIIVSEAKGRIMKVRSDYFRFMTSSDTFGTFPNGRWIALKLDASKIPEGTYDLAFDFQRADYGHEIYFAPYVSEKENASDYLNEDNKIADVSGRNVMQITAKDVELDSTATDYVLIIKQKKSQETKPVSITFTRKLDYKRKHTEKIEYNFNSSVIDPDAYDQIKYDTGTSTVIHPVQNSGFKYVNWETVCGRKSVMDLSKTAPWSLNDYVVLGDKIYGSGNRIDTVRLRIDFTSKNYGAYEEDSNKDNVGAYFILRLYVPYDGTFDIDISGGKHTSGGKADVYISKATQPSYGPEDIKSLMKVKIGTFSTANNALDMKAEKIEIEQGENILLFVPHSEETANRNYIEKITLTPTDDAGYTEAFKESDSKAETYAPNVVAYAYAKDSTDIGVNASAKDDDADGVWTLEAPEKVGDYKFLYWAKGLTTSDNRLVVSTSATYNEYIPQNNNNYVIAVYDKAGETPKAEFYNANGQLIETLKENGNAPALPYMAGYGQASNWALHGTSTKINGGDPVTLSGNMIFFAQYDTATPDTFAITVNGKSENYNYGQLVECKADATDTDGNIFYGWTKTVNGGDAQLVSADPIYTFHAWENCTVTPVYKKTTGIIFDGAKQKILLGTFDLGGEQAVMAEYIGFEDADEKGIILGTQEIAMTSDNNQFTVVNNDEATSISGYAILSGTKYIFNK